MLSNGIRNNSGLEVFGAIRNDTGSPIHAGALALTFYDASGNIISVFPGIVDVDLGQGQTTAYLISTAHNFSYVSYVVQAQGYVIK